ncbi:flippase [Mucilaginibacter sp. R-33]|uniref:flippase n=1 Tax=unclassified Mucilaginibacter TaxID=2617802 RepID=UPI003CE90E2E
MSYIKKNYLFNLLLTVVNLIFPILSFPYAARILGPAGIGKVQFITSFTQYFALIAALGIPVYGIREIAKVKNQSKKLDQTFSELTFISILTSALLSIIYLIVIATLTRFQRDINFYFAATTIILFGFCSIDWFYSGIEQFKIIALRSVSIKAISLILLYLLVKTPHDIFIYLLINVFALVGNNFINIFLVGKKVNLVTKGLNFKRHYRPLFFIFSTTIASSMYTLLDVVILGFLANDKSVGYYSAGVKLAKITIPFVTSLGAVVMPRISFNLNEKNLEGFYSLLNQSFQFITFISVPISFGLLLLSKEAIILFSGNKFLPAEGVMQILSFLPFVIGMGYFFGIQILIASGKDKQMFISVCVGMIVSLALNFLLIPAFKEEGAAYANIISEVFVTFAYIFYVNKAFEFKIKISGIFQAVISSLTFIPVIFISKLFIHQMIVQLLADVIICALFYLAIQFYLFKNEVSQVVYNMFISYKKNIFS